MPPPTRHCSHHEPKGEGPRSVARSTASEYVVDVVSHRVVRPVARQACRSAHRFPARWLAVLGALALLAEAPACRSGMTKGELYLQYGFERLALGDTTGALDYMQRARFELNDETRVLFHIARLLAADGTIRGRDRAQKLLSEVVRREPENAMYRAELGILLRQQRYVRGSTKHLVEAVRIDSSLARAWSVLGLNLQEEYFARLEEEALLDSAVACYRRALDLEETDQDTRYRLAFLHMHRDEFSAARDLVAPYAYRGDCPQRFGLLLVALLFHTRQFESAQLLLDELLDCMPWQERESWIGLKPLMHPDSASVYTTLIDAKRDSACTGFWWARDPTPTTLVNERLIEHVARAVEANTYFEVALLGREGRHTDRGEVYLRYGAPASINRTFYKTGWVWRYPSGNPDDPTTFLFFDTYHNGDYVRLRRTAFSDFSREAAFEATPEVSGVTFKQRRGSWDYVVRQFRAAGGHTALEIAYVVEPTPFLEAMQIDVAAWRGPHDIAASQRSTAAAERLYLLEDGRAVGRVRIEVAPREYVVGLKAIAIRADDVIPLPGPNGRIDRDKIAWIAMERDTVALWHFDASTLQLSDVILAHELRPGVGGLFDMGGVLAVPRVGARVQSDLLHLYFEAYPTQRVLREGTALAVTYEVRPLPPATWSFWDQFRGDYRRRMNPAQRPLVQATFTFLPSAEVERQHLSIDISRLEAGPYVLIVELIDTASGETAGRSVAFEYVHPDGDEPGS